MPCRVPIQNASPTCSCPSHKSTQNTINNSSLGKVARQPSTPHPHPKKISSPRNTDRDTSLSLYFHHHQSTIFPLYCAYSFASPNTNLAHTHSAIQLYPQNPRMKLSISLTNVSALFAPIVLFVVVVEAGGHTTPGGTILDVGDCRSRYCPRNTFGMDTTTTINTTTTTLITHPRTVGELFRFGGGRNHDDDVDGK